MKYRLFISGAVAAATMTALPAHAHITLEKREASPASYYKAVFMVPHGCAGSPTTKIRVRIPEGVIAVKPMPKPGWSIETIRSAYSVSYQLHGSAVSEGVREVAWSGKLADDNYDEFVLSTYLTSGLKSDTTLYFPVVQECEQGVSRWIEIPQEGKPAHDSKSPAPGLKLVPKP
jgi:uncharacterized protein YcnI